MTPEQNTLAVQRRKEKDHLRYMANREARLEHQRSIYDCEYHRDYRKRRVADEMSRIAYLKEISRRVDAYFEQQRLEEIKENRKRVIQNAKKKQEAARKGGGGGVQEARKQARQGVQPVY